MRTSIMSAVAGLLVSAAPVLAQAPSPVADALRASVKSAEQNLVGSAEEMPADKYGYHPTEPQMTFGQLALHVATSNEFLCSRIGGTTAPTEAKLTATSPKDQLVARLKRSFAFCASSFANLTDAALTDSVPFFGGRKVTRAAAIIDVTSDWADHYSQAAGYLRLNGMLPPTAKGRGGM